MYLLESPPGEGLLHTPYFCHTTYAFGLIKGQHMLQDTCVTVIQHVSQCNPTMILYISTVNRGLDKKEYLMIIRGNFC